ncbi:MAG TPA: hypothetical protein GXZ47_07910 [Treponema sp.]|nr:hypothetical protein [Treponema sp.]
MNNNKKATELMAVLDYILNRCTIREIDAVSAAVDRRKEDLTASTGIISLDPDRAAHVMSSAVQQSIDQGMEGVRKTFREFAVDLLHKEAPELTKEQMAELVDTWIPKDMVPSDRSQGHKGANQGNYRGLSQKGLINGIEPELMYEMINQFIAYSTGAMGLSEESELRDAVGDWTTVYWKKFPVEIQNCIRKFLSGSLTVSDFDRELLVLLR